MANSLGSASIPFFACACLLVVIVLQVVAFASPYWVTVVDDKIDAVGYTDMGLWRYSRCLPKRLTSSSVGSDLCKKTIKREEVGDWLMAVRGLECAAVICWSIPLVVVPVYLYVSLGLYYRCTMATMAVFTIVGCIGNIAGVIIFGIKINDTSLWDYGWCLIVAAVAGGLGIFAFIIFIVSFCNRPIFSPATHLTSGFYVDPDRNRMYVIENFDDLKSEPLDGHVNPAMN